MTEYRLLAEGAAPQQSNATPEVSAANASQVESMKEDNIAVDDDIKPVGNEYVH